MDGKICSGCGACVAVCPRNCLKLVMNDEGFFEVSDKGEGCINCGLCERVCPFVALQKKSHPVATGYFVSPDSELRAGSSSGGVCGTLSNWALDSGVPVVGAVYDNIDNSVSHRVANNIADSYAFRGSKYLQSDPSAIYSAMERGDCLITGTPCQIAGARLFSDVKRLKGEFSFVDFYCHGVPSYYLWSKYLNSNEILNNTYVNFRDKSQYGWKDYTLYVQCVDKSHCSAYLHDGDFFYSSFLSNLCLNKPCYYACPFRGTSSLADLRVGDAWGHDVAGDNLGTSVVLAYGDKGRFLLDHLDRIGGFVPEKVSVAASAQISSGVPVPKARESFIRALKGPSDTNLLMCKFVKPQLKKKLWRSRFEHLVAILTGKEYKG